jgi:signal transduction histidine kinase
MTPFLIIFIVFLLIVVCVQYKAIKQRNQHLDYIQKKLNAIMADHTNEKLLAFTDDQYLIPVLKEINNLLDNNQKTMVNYRKMEEAMRKMLSNVSHDLKTPLTVILGYVETVNIDSTLSSEEREKVLSKVQNKTIELLNLIDKFFNLAKLESGDKDIPITRMNMNEVCRKNILSFYDVLTDRGFDVRINIPENSFYVFGNEEAFDRILNNLISNAIKYGAEGNVLGLDVSADDEFVYVIIWDRGKGINELHKDEVFERLYTLEDSRNKSYQGSGLGLTITKRLVEKLDGEISVHSKPYDKTAFSVKLKRMSY